MKHSIAFASFVLSAAAVAAPRVENVELTQDASSGLVTVTYDLKDEAAIVTLDVLVGGTSVGFKNLTALDGDVNRLVAVGDGKRIAWHPNGEWNGKAASAVARVKAWTPSDPPDYLVANLAFVDTVRYYEDAVQVPEGVTATVYKTSKLLMRRIHAKGVTWKIGSTTGLRDWQREACFDVKLTNDFYIAVYPFTQGQYYHVWGQRPGSNTYGGDTTEWKWSTYPMNFCGYSKLRGKPADGYDWPTDGHKVAPDSLLQSFRTRTGLTGLDLPVEAQWEFAARAGDYTHDLYNGYNLASETGDENQEAIAWTTDDTDPSGAKTTWPVGLKQPNAYGLYDMLGNVYEICVSRFQWKDDYPDADYDANIGCVSQYASQRIMRGGSSVTNNGNRPSRVCYRDNTSEDDDAGRADKGFRLSLTLYP